MNDRKPAPIGPLAIALRHLRRPGSRVGLLAIILAAALLIGIGLLLLR